MSRAFRVVLVWLVAAVIPLKGLAAATVLGCGPGHEGLGVLVGDGHGHAGVHAKGSGHGPVHEHGHGHADAHEAPAAAGAQAEPAEPRGQGADPLTPTHGLALKCSSCSPCCAAAAPAPQTLVLPGGARASSPVAFGDTRYTGIVGDVPHRPPRLILA